MGHQTTQILPLNSKGHTKMQVTFYTNVYGKEFLDIPLMGLLTSISSGKWKDTVEKYRKDKNPETKKKAPAFTASGTFPKNRKANELGTHSGLIAIDFDSLEDIDHARSELYADEYTFAGFVSIGGGGLCVLVKIDGSKHIQSFKGLEHYYFTKYNLQADQQCSDVSRLRFISYDPDMYLNPNSKKFTELPKSNKGRPAQGKATKNFVSTNSDIEYVVNQIQQTKTDITASYDDWISIGLGLKAQIGEAGKEYYHAISQYHPGYDYDTTERKWNSFPSQLNTKSNPISALFAISKQYGLSIQSPEMAKIKRVAGFGKKRKASTQDIVDQLEQIDGIPPEKSREVVESVYESDADPTQDDDLVTLIAEYIARHTDIRFNEISLKYEMNKQAMTDRDLNSLFLDIKLLSPKVSKELVASVVESDRTKSYNPVKEYLAGGAATNKPIGLIRKLASSIDTGGMHSEEYVAKFIRYWMIGCVATWMKQHSPLMLVLAGSAQNTGKTHFFRYILPQEFQPYFGEAELTGDKDENLLMCNKILILNDEMSNKSKRDIAMVKKLCSVQWFNIRKPYGRNSEDIRRIAGLCGTSNDYALISDPSGNRRILPIAVKSIDRDTYNSIDKGLLWTEAYIAYKSGEKYQLDKQDIDELSGNSSDFEESSIEREGLVALFIPSDKDANGVQMLTNTQIKSYIEIRTKQRLSSRKLGMELRRIGLEPSTQRINGIPVKVYPLKTVTMESVEKVLEDPTPF
jgi:predicted P-loop ATPase